MQQQQQNQNWQQPAPPQGDNGKTIAILSYCTLIGFIIAIVMHSSNKTRLGAYHLRQALGLIIFSIGFGIVMGIVIGILAFITFGLAIFLAPITWLFVIIMMIIGIINASNEKETPLPIIGKMTEKMLASVFV